VAGGGAGREGAGLGKAHNAKSTALLEARKEQTDLRAHARDPEFEEKIPTPDLLGDTVYNFWKDDVHERGLWRRTSLASYRTAARVETVLDLALAKADGKAGLEERGLPATRVHAVCHALAGRLRRLRAARVRHEGEAVRARRLLLPEAKSSVSWKDEDTLWVGTDFGPGRSTSGYPRIVKLWKRGTPLTSARTVYEGKTESRSFGNSQILSDRRYDLVTRIPGLFRRVVPRPRRPSRQAERARDFSALSSATSSSSH
jgi:prolyl oligopeptidase